MNQYWSIEPYSWLALVWSQLMNQYWNSIINLLLCFFMISLFYLMSFFLFQVSIQDIMLQVILSLYSTLGYYQIFLVLNDFDRFEVILTGILHNVLQKEFDVFSHDQTSVASFEKTTTGWKCHFHHCMKGKHYQHD